jgi:hypothetical protein
LARCSEPAGGAALLVWRPAGGTCDTSGNANPGKARRLAVRQEPLTLNAGD